MLEKYIAQQKNLKKQDHRISSDLIRNYFQSNQISLSLIDKEFDESDIVPASNTVFSAHTPNGYLPESSVKNEDIYIIKTNEVGLQDTILLPSSINTRFNETSPVLSSDGKTLFFSSNAGVNHGGLDIYISHREDTNSVDNWSTPILLGKKINSAKDDYVLSLNKYKIVVSNANGANKKAYLIDDDLELDITISPKEDNIWLSKNQIAILFERDRSVISKHIKKIFEDDEEYDASVLSCYWKRDGINSIQTERFMKMVMNTLVIAIFFIMNIILVSIKMLSELDPNRRRADFLTCMGMYKKDRDKLIMKEILVDHHFLPLVISMVSALLFTFVVFHARMYTAADIQNYMKLMVPMWVAYVLGSTVVIGILSVIYARTVEGKKYARRS